MTDTSYAKYKLAPGTQVREEGFGLLFYTQQGPRLYFLACGSLLDASFFEGRQGLEQWLAGQRDEPGHDRGSVAQMQQALHQLGEKGVILEC